MRFIFLELGFRLASKKGISKLTKIIGIKTLNKNVAQQRTELKNKQFFNIFFAIFL